MDTNFVAVRRPQTLLSVSLLFLSGAVLAADPSATNQVAAAEAPATNKVEVLPTIIVTASRVAENINDTPRTVVNISRQAVEEKHAIRAEQLLEDEPGVWMQKTGMRGGTPIIRGLMGNTVLYLVDGIRINDGRTFYGPNGRFNTIDVGSVDHIEILKGPGAVQYGTDAMGGVINVITPSTDWFTDKLTFRGKFSAQYTSADNAMMLHGEAGVADTNVNAVGGFTYVRAHDVRTGRGERLDNTSYNSYGIFGKISERLCKGNVLTIGYLNDINTDVETYDQSHRNTLSGTPKSFSPWNDRRILYLKDAAEFNKRWLSRVDTYVYWQNVRDKGESFSENTKKHTVSRKTSRDAENIFGTGLSAETPLIEEKLSLVYGADYRYEYDHASVYQDTWPMSTPAAYVRSYPTGNKPDGIYDVADAFAMLVWTPVEDLRLNGGIRCESTHLNSDPDALDPSAGFTESDLDLNKRWTALTYDLGALYKLTENLDWTANVSTGYRAPTYSDVLNFGTFTYGVNVPNPDVDPEQNLAGETGLRWHSRSLVMNATVFGDYLWDRVNKELSGGYTDLNGNGVQDAGEANYAKKNMGKAYITGVEGDGEWKYWHDYSIFGNIAWTFGQDTTQDTPLPFIPPLHGVLGTRVPVTDWMRFSVFARLVAPLVRVNETDKSDTCFATDPSRTYPATDNPPLRADYSIPGYVTWHARVDFKIFNGGRLYFGVDNILDKAYRVAFTRQDAPGISACAGAEWSF